MRKPLIASVHKPNIRSPCAFSKQIIGMPNLEQFVDFNPEKDIGSLEEKVIFVTGGLISNVLYLANNITDNP